MTPDRYRCRLCGLRSCTTLCGGCADRLERELVRDPKRACPDCGRHRELCASMPCTQPASVKTGYDEKAREKAEEASIVWLDIDLIQEPTSAHNSRQSYQPTSIRELAGSLQRDGFLQPLCVRRTGGGYQVVFGVRRLRAARQAGFRQVPCVIRRANDDQAFLLNAVENLHRVQLSSVERVATIERLAASGLGVREISRRTGFNPSTISRWLRINRCTQLKEAFENGSIDVARAAILVEAPDAVVGTLIEQAATLSRSELQQRVVASKHAQPARPPADTDGRALANALRCLQSVTCASDAQILESIRQEVQRLSAASLSNASLAK